MKRLMTAILFGAAMLLAATLRGTDFRVDLLVEKNICGLVFQGASEGVRGTNAKWLKENTDRRLVINGKVGETWEEKSFQFSAKEDCEVNIHLLADLAGKVRPWVAYDNIRIEGATLKNGSFEHKKTKGGGARYWYSWSKSKYVLKIGDEAAAGKNYIEVSHDHRAIQRIKCKKDQQVTVTFMVRNIKRTTDQP